MEPEKSNGAMVGSIIIIIILIVGGVYLWRTSLNDSEVGVPTISEDNDEEAAQLEAELNSLDLESLDGEI